MVISSYAAKMPDVQLNIREGEEYKLKDLLYSLMLESHNDSAVAIAEHIGGSVEQFAELMNQKAVDIGCMKTHFITPNGLDAKDKHGIHGTTAADLARILRYCIKESPEKDTFLTITRTSVYSFTNLAGTRSFTCNNHNAFLNMMDGALTGKTGFTGTAGYCYVGALERDGKLFIVALLGCGWPGNKTYKWADTKKLMNYGLDHYQEHTIKDDILQKRTFLFSMIPITEDSRMQKRPRSHGTAAFQKHCYCGKMSRSLSGIFCRRNLDFRCKPGCRLVPLFCQLTVRSMLFIRYLLQKQYPK